MAGSAMLLKIDEKRAGPSLQEAGAKLDAGHFHTGAREVFLDFSCVRHVDSVALQALQKVAGIADEKAVRIVLQGVNVDVYKVLKLVNLTQRFSFVN